MVRLFHQLRKGNRVLFIILYRVNKLFEPRERACIFLKVLTVHTLTSHVLTLKAHITKSRMLFLLSAVTLGSLFNKQCRSRSDCSYRSSLNRSSLIWVYTVCVYTYVKQYTDTFECSYFAGV